MPADNASGWQSPVIQTNSSCCSCFEIGAVKFSKFAKFLALTLQLTISDLTVICVAIPILLCNDSKRHQTKVHKLLRNQGLVLLVELCYDTGNMKLLSAPDLLGKLLHNAFKMSQTPGQRQQPKQYALTALRWARSLNHSIALVSGTPTVFEKAHGKNDMRRFCLAIAKLNRHHHIRMPWTGSSARTSILDSILHLSVMKVSSTSTIRGVQWQMRVALSIESEFHNSYSMIVLSINAATDFAIAVKPNTPLAYCAPPWLALATATPWRCVQSSCAQETVTEIKDCEPMAPIGGS